MTKDTGYIQLRRGIWEHLRTGRMTHMEVVAFIYICSEADTRTGIWYGHAGALSRELSMSRRTSRDLLERMEQGGYIKRLAMKKGDHRCFPILVNHFFVTQGVHEGKYTNAQETTSPGQVVYFSRHEDVNDHVHEHGDEHGDEHVHSEENREKRKEKREKRRKTKTHAHQTSMSEGVDAPGDAFEVFWTSYPRKVCKEAAKKAYLKVAKEGGAILTGLEIWKRSDDWNRELRYIPHATTFLNQRRWESPPTAEPRKDEYDYDLSRFADKKP